MTSATETESELLAKSIVSPPNISATTIAEVIGSLHFAGADGEDLTADLQTLTEALAAEVDAVAAGDLSKAEALWHTQAQALNAIFNTYVMRAAKASADRFDLYMRHALKAQAQCRQTLQALMDLKAPRPQKMEAHNGISGNVETLEKGTAPGTSRTDSRLETMDQEHRTEDARRQSEVFAELLENRHAQRRIESVAAVPGTVSQSGKGN